MPSVRLLADESVQRAWAAALSPNYTCVPASGEPILPDQVLLVHAEARVADVTRGLGGLVLAETMLSDPANRGGGLVVLSFLSKAALRRRVRYDYLVGPAVLRLPLGIDELGAVLVPWVECPASWAELAEQACRRREIDRRELRVREFCDAVRSRDRARSCVKSTATDLAQQLLDGAGLLTPEGLAALARIAHNLKGFALQFCLDELARQCSQLESLAEAGEVDAAAIVLATVGDTLPRSVDAILAQLEATDDQ